MKIFYIIVVFAVLLWKAYYAFLRGQNTIKKDIREHYSLYEYLLGNGATEQEARRPFLLHSLKRAFYPLASQWRLLLILLAFALLMGIVIDSLTIRLALLLLLVLMFIVALGIVITICIYSRIQKPNRWTSQ